MTKKLWAGLVIGVLVSGAAMAQEGAPAGPTIQHAPVSQAQPGQPLTLTATIHSGNGVFQPTVYFRHAGEQNWTKVPLIPSGGDIFTATLPGATLSSNVEYYLETYDNDGNGPARAGSPDAPFQVAVAMAAPSRPAQAVASAPAAPRSATTATVNKQSPALSGKKLGAIVSAGVGVVGLAVGVVGWVQRAQSVANQAAASASVEGKYIGEIQNETILGVVGTVIGVAGIGVGAYLWFSSPASPSSPSGAPSDEGAGLSISPVPGGAMAAFAGRF